MDDRELIPTQKVFGECVAVKFARIASPIGVNLEI
jgi:hypothetical protein